MRVKAPVLYGANAPMRMEALDVADPRAREVVVRMAASGVCHSCLNVANGTQTRAPMPIVLGDEGAGTVVAVGPGVTRLAVGQHVILSWAPGCGRCRFCDQGRPVLCTNGAPFGFMEDGTTRFTVSDTPVHHFGPATYAPFTVVSERAAIAIPEDFPLDLAALIGCSVTTGLGAVVKTGAVQPGQSVAVLGCGGVGLNAVQGARLVGAHPILAIDPVEARRSEALELGATHALDPASVPVLPDAVCKLVGYVDCVAVAVGSPAAVSDAMKLLAPGGVAVAVGVPPPGAELSIEAGPLLAGERRLVGCKYGSANPAVDFPWIVELAKAGKITLDRLISRRYALDAANEAFDDLTGGRLARGLIVFDDAK